MINALITILYHEIIATLRQSFSWVTTLLFFILIVCLFPLALGNDTALLRHIAPGIIWVAALTAILLSLGNLFRQDAEAGHLDLLLLSPYPLTLIVLCKLTAHWLTTCLPLILMSPLLGALLQLSWQQEYMLVITLLLGTPALCLLGGVGAALTVGIRGTGLLLPLLIMPLYVPILIVGTSASTALVQHQPIIAYLATLGALALLSSAFAPFLTGAALRIGVNQ